MGVLRRVLIGVFIGVPNRMSVLTRRFVGRVAAVFPWRWNATSLRHGQRGSQQHEECKDGRQDSLHAISYSGRRRHPASAPTREAVKPVLPFEHR